MTKSIKRIATIIMAAVIVLTAFSPTEAQAASRKKAAYPVVTAGNAKIAKKSAKAYSTNITAGKKAKLVVKASGKNVTKKAKYVSSKKSVATVNKNGIVSAKKAGTAKIKVTYKGKTSTVTVKVAKKAVRKPASNGAVDNGAKGGNTEHAHTDACYKWFTYCRCGQKFEAGSGHSEHVADIALMVDLGLINDSTNNHSATNAKSLVCNY